MAGAVAYWILQRFAESETPVPFAEGLLAKVRGVDEGIVGSRSRSQGIEMGARRMEEKKAKYAGLVNGVGGNEREGRPSSLFGILEDDDFGMPDSTKTALRDISQRRERAVGQA